MPNKATDDRPIIVPRAALDILCEALREQEVKDIAAYALGSKLEGIVVDKIADDQPPKRPEPDSSGKISAEAIDAWQREVLAHERKAVKLNLSEALKGAARDCIKARVEAGQLKQGHAGGALVAALDLVEV